VSPVHVGRADGDQKRIVCRRVEDAARVAVFAVVAGGGDHDDAAEPEPLERAVEGIRQEAGLTLGVKREVGDADAVLVLC
jgi:hypothetical protein